MSNSTQALVLVADEPAVTGLVTTARTLATEVVAVVAGRREVADAVAPAVDRVLWLPLPDGLPVEALASEVARVVAEAAPRGVVGATTGAGRALLGAVAARVGAPVLQGVTAVESGEQVVVTHGVLGGISEHRSAVEGVVVLAVGPGAVAEAGAAAPVEEVAVAPLTGVTITDVRTKERADVDLGAARTVVAVGRGLKAREDVALIEDLTRALGGELACSRPLAEGVDWLAKERYIGISGQHVSPALYVAVGISGQLQHMVGVRDAGVVVAVNSDRDAPIFAQCDYGIVGDLYQVVPALTAAVGATS
ncbi:MULTISPECIES: electron transfer flavoprotein subunit alpha/FixB family protein [unclassified Actinotalea]|uniref:electron transfer flavoprotein subunit alpha/FixB family protein n=1 Tax=unclassified Actinotalea TaxID=2638618 RepID=UPI0015F39FE4|nr:MULTISPECIES: electron transfer flavoprotein subunit alpha/FixB family protein [unclassified Actinotalea]